MPIPQAFEGVKKGDWLHVKRAGGVLGRRGKESGLVVSFDDKGASLDFFTCGQCGAEACPCYTSIEFWEWDELEPVNDPAES